VYLEVREDPIVEVYHSYIFALVPFISWVASGTLKFIINYTRFGFQARQLVGNGGFPSTHTSVVSSITILIGLITGWNSPLFGLGVAVTYIVIIDALGVRRAVGTNAKQINVLTKQINGHLISSLREKQGHTRTEILGGLGVGSLIAWCVYWFLL
jgi:acid phosphatase family membrane protein YuiD